MARTNIYSPLFFREPNSRNSNGFMQRRFESIDSLESRVDFGLEKVSSDIPNHGYIDIREEGRPTSALIAESIIQEHRRRHYC